MQNPLSIVSGLVYSAPDDQFQDQSGTYDDMCSPKDLRKARRATPSLVDVVPEIPVQPADPPLYILPETIPPSSPKTDPSLITELKKLQKMLDDQQTQIKDLVKTQTEELVKKGEIAHFQEEFAGFQGRFQGLEEAKVDQTELRTELKNELDKIVHDHVMKAVSKVVGPIDDKSFAEKETPVPPDENLNVNESNMIQYFIRNPGTGPFTLLIMLAYNMGLLSEPMKSAQLNINWKKKSEPEDDKVSELKKAVERARSKIVDQKASDLKEEAVKNALSFINGLAGGRQMFTNKLTKLMENFTDSVVTKVTGKEDNADQAGNGSTNGQNDKADLTDVTKDIGDFANRAQTDVTKDIGDLANKAKAKVTAKVNALKEEVNKWTDFFDNFNSKDGVQSDMDLLSDIPVTSAWQLALVPVLMLVVQFAYVFFVWFEAYQNYAGSGFCPGYNFLFASNQYSINYWPEGGDPETRILAAFIGGYFCVRVLQQFFTFLSILKDDNLDPNVLPTSHNDSDTKTIWNLWGRLESVTKTASDYQIKDIKGLLTNLATYAPKFAEKFGGKLLIDALQEAMKRYLLSIIDKVANLKGLVHKPLLLKDIENIEKQIDDLLDALASDEDTYHEGQQGNAAVNDSGKGADTGNEAGMGNGGGKDSGAEKNAGDEAKNGGQTKVQLLGKGVKETLKNRRFLLAAGGMKQLPPAATVPVGWRSPKWSWIYPFYLLDCFAALALMLSVFLVNLYIVFVDGVSTRDMILNVVLLDFIYEQLPKFKAEIFNGQMAKKLLYTLKVTYNQPPANRAWKVYCRLWRRIAFNLIIVVSFIAFLVSAAMLIYGPLCKPGPDKAGTVPTVSKPGK